MMRRISRRELSVTPVPMSHAIAAKIDLTLHAHAAHAQALTQAQDDIVEITNRAIGTLVQAELTLTPEHIRNVVHELVREVRGARQMIVHVHPADRALLPSAQQLAQDADAQGAFEVVEDDSLSRGDCTLTSDLGDIDGRMTTKLAQLQRLLTRRGGP